MEVHGEVALFEGQQACRPLQRHLYGRRGLVLWAFPAAIILVPWLGEKLMALLPLNPILAAAAPLLVVAVSVVAFFSYLRRLPRASWLRRGVPETFVIQYRVEDTGLVIDGEFSETRLAWKGLSEIIPGVGAWLFIGQGSAHFLPKRLFADPTAERAFLTNCLDHMSPEARALSTAATTFASGT